MWERYHFFAALELEQWKGTYVGCVVIPKKYLRYYDPRYVVLLFNLLIRNCDLMVVVASPTVMLLKP
jgi:hypothetical protein